MRAKAIHPFLSPRSVALIGATDKPGSVGRAVLCNLLTGMPPGAIYPVNPGRATVHDVPAYPTIGAVPGPVDLAVIVTPAATVPGIVGECADAGVSAVVIISAGFHEMGEAGMVLEEQVLARRGAMRIIGPNCLGVMCPRTGLNATFAAGMALPGSVGLISQSGALCTGILDWSLREKVGFSAFLSIGSMLDVGLADLIDCLGDDPYTKSIAIYMESIGDARSFLSAAREVALTKPIIVLKSGRQEASARAAASHTGALASSDEALDAAFARCGVLRVNTIAELFYMAEALEKQPRPKGPRLTIVTNAGGPGVLAADALLTEGGVLAPLAPKTLTALDEVLPASWSHNNPIDILGDAAPERFAQAVRIAADDPNTDAILAVLTPQAMTEPTRTAKLITDLAPSVKKPLLASWMGGDGVAEGARLLRAAGIPCLPYPDTAARIAQMMWRHTKALSNLYETPHDVDESRLPDRLQASNIVRYARSSGRTLLTQREAMEILSAYGIHSVETHIAHDIEAAVQCADMIGYPVALKLHSQTITHKTDVGGVVLGVKDEQSVRNAYAQMEKDVLTKAGLGHFQGVALQPMMSRDGCELIVGSRVDPQLGPIILFGAGGQLVEVFRDTALALPPLNSTLARRLMERTKIIRALIGVRGRKPVPLAALEDLLVRFSRLAVDLPEIAEIEINPLLATPDRLLALDARVILHGPDVRAERLPRPAIRPYPSRYAAVWTSSRGEYVMIRPIRPEDEPLMAAFHETLSDTSVYLRYFSLMGLSQRIAHERLTRMCFIDYDRQMALVAEQRDPKTGARDILGVGRLLKEHGSRDAEFALIVADRFQGHGLGDELLRRLLRFAEDEGIERVTGDILPGNAAMLHVAGKHGFVLTPDPAAGITKAERVIVKATL